MTTFTVSLFLPYTIDFHDSPTPDQQKSPPYAATPGIPRTDSANDLRGFKSSLFGNPTPPMTPSIAAHYDYFFSNGEPSKESYFPKPHDPRALVRNDSHAPAWGQEQIFNQPRSRAEPAPPDTILQYAFAQEHAKKTKKQKAETADRVAKAQKANQKRISPKRKLSGPASWGSKWQVEPAIQGNGGLANAVRAAVGAGSVGDVLSIGLIGFPTDSLEDSTKDDIHDKLEQEYDALTVYVSDSDLDGHYAHYCKTILWPVFHYQIPDHPKSKAYEDHSWEYYVNLNQAFADKVIKNYKRGDTIWIHDYHLLLVPAMLRKKLPDAQIGFFLHTAFPSSEVFRCLAMRKELLAGMLGANLVAFQIPEYAHHFVQTCSRLLTVEATDHGVQLDYSFVNVTSLPIGINPTALISARKEPEVITWIKSMEDRYKGKRIIVARDKLDHVGGVRQKLLAFELFLNKYPELRDKVVMMQVATSTTEDPELAATISEIVTRIDAVHSTLAHQPLVFLRQDISFSQYLALLSIADALMITSLREGMNLTCHEFIICQDGATATKKHGPIILSEFTGSASVLGEGTISVNPWDYQKCAKAIKQALNMSSIEKESRYRKLEKIVYSQTGEFWATSLTKQLAKFHTEHFENDTMSIPRLNLSQLMEKYKRANKRLFLLDYEGTLTSYGSVNNTVFHNPQRIFDTLNELSIDPQNLVYVMSGLTMEELCLTFSRVPGIGLIAENGCFLRPFHSGQWIPFADAGMTKRWKEAVKGLLEYYHERVEGSSIEERTCSIIFRYEKAEDQDSAMRQAGDFANHINDGSDDNQKVRAIPSKNEVVVEPVDWDKSTATTYIWDQLVESKESMPDFVMVAGNDRDDEVVFKWAKGLSDIVPSVTTVSVGNRNTVATTTMTQGSTGLISVLGRLAKLS